MSFSNISPYSHQIHSHPADSETLQEAAKDDQGSLQGTDVKRVAPTSSLYDQALHKVNDLWTYTKSLFAPTPQAAPAVATGIPTGETALLSEKTRRRFQQAFDKLASGRFLAKKMDLLASYLQHMLAKHPELATVPMDDGNWALHLAIQLDQTALVDKLLELGAGAPAFDAAVQKGDDTLSAKIFEVILKYEGALLRQSNPQAAVDAQVQAVRAALASSTHHQNYAHAQSLCRRGLAGHNPLLVNAIETGDTKTFVRLIMDGASCLTLNQHGQSLLHLAALHNSKPIALLLLSQKLNPALPDHEGATFDALARANGWTEFFLEDPSSAEQLKKEGEILGKIAADYEKERQGYSQEMRAFNQNKALHGSTGHNQLLIACLVHNDARQFIEAAEMGASIDTIDDHGYSLLHYAVETNAIEIMDYLLLQFREKDPAAGNSLHPNLSPIRINHSPSESASYLLQESPLSMACRKGNFSAACLLLTQGDTTHTFNFTAQHKDVQAALHSWQKLARMRDPLNITVQEKSRVFSSLCWALLTAACSYSGLSGQSALLLSMQAAFIAERGFQKCYFQDAIAEHLVNPQPAVSLPAPVQNIYSHMSQMAFAEMLTNPSLPIATMASMGLRTCVEAKSSFQTIQNTWSDARTSKAAIKAAVNLAPTLKTIYHFSNLLALYSRPIDVEAMLSENTLTEKHLRDNPAEAEKLLHLLRWRRLDRHLKDADIAQLNVGLIGADPVLDTPAKINDAFLNTCALTDYERNLAQAAKDVLLERVKPFNLWDTSSWQMSGHASLAGKTALNIGLVWLMHRTAALTNHSFQTVGLASLMLYSIGCWTYSTFRPRNGDAEIPPSSPSPPEAKPQPLVLALGS